MVKNAGGNKSKKVARKNVGSSTATHDVRKAADASEMYAVISKIYSSQRCSVLGADGNTYQCTVRGKFLKGKRSGNNSISVGVWVIIGFYDWEVRSDGKKNCDLLEIYSPAEKEKLKQFEAHNLSAIMSIGELAGAEKEFAFSQFDNTQIPLEEIESSSEEEGDDKVVKEKAVAAAVPIIKQTAQDQMDWLAIDVNDI